MPIVVTAEDIARFAPNAKPEYVDALLGNLDVLKDAGILENGLRLSHWFGQVAAETAGMSKFRESMAYSANRLRQVWPARFKSKTDAYLSALAADPVKLADAVYGGRMGNVKGTRDGYSYRGGGWIQITGRGLVEEYCAELGLDPSPSILDDPVDTLRMACLYWTKHDCNQWADADDILKLSRAINVGNANSKVTPVGLNHRKDWFAKAHAIWGNAQPVEEPAPAVASSDGIFSRQCFSQLNELADQGSRVAGWVRSIKRWFWGGATATTATVAVVDANRGTAGAFVELVRDHPFITMGVFAAIVCALFYLALKVIEKYLITAAKDGRYKPKGAK